jgi:putative ABC transport system permease protein
VKDFHFKSLHTAIEPQIMILDPAESPVVSCRLSDVKNNVSLDFIRQTVGELSPDQNVRIEFLEDSLEAAYRDDKITGRLLILFTILSIFVSILGLTGLMAFVSEQRIPEIGIRKTYGASSGSILRLFSVRYLRLIAIALLISWPLAYFAVNKYLQNFPDRIGVPFGDFIVAGIIVLTLVELILVLVSMKTVRKTANVCLRHN